MGSAIGTGRKSLPPTEDEMIAYFEVKKAYEALSPTQRQQEAELLNLARLYRSKVAEYHSASVKMSQEVANLLGMSEEEKLEHSKAVLAAAVQKEKCLQPATVSGTDDHDGYVKSFGGTKQDTQVENEFSSLVRGDEDIKAQEKLIPAILRPIKCDGDEERVSGVMVKCDVQELTQLRSAGKWMRYLGAKGCYLWIHSLTREVTPLRPQEYVVDEERTLVENTEGDDKCKESGGYPSCPFSELFDTIKTIIRDDNKTPLLIELSGRQSDSVPFVQGHFGGRFGSGHRVPEIRDKVFSRDLIEKKDPLELPRASESEEVSDLMETVRSKAVAAMKAGTTFVLRLGHLTSEHANFKKKLCLRSVFPVEMFQQGGKKIFTPTTKPRFSLMFRETEMEQGQCLVKQEGFRFCVVTSLKPNDVVEMLGDSIPLGYMQPVRAIAD